MHSPLHFIKCFLSRSVSLAMLVVLCCSTNCIWAKEGDKSSGNESKDLTKANYYYTHYAYIEAIPFFEKLEGNEISAANYAKLGDCHRMTGDLGKAADTYAKAVKMRGCKDQVFLRYAQVLMTLMRYDEAEKWLLEFQKTNKMDKRVVSMIAGCKSAPERMKAQPDGAAYLTTVNTNGLDFAPTLWRGNLVFTSDTAIGLKKKTDVSSGNSFLNIYRVSCDNRGLCNPDYTKFGQSHGLNSKYHDGPCTFSADGSTMYFTRSRSKDKMLGQQSVANADGAVLLEIMIATEYDADQNRFKNIEPFEFNSDDHSVAHPAVSPNGKTLVFAAFMKGSAGGADLFICKKKPKDGTWSRPLNAGKLINTEGEEEFPYFADDSTLFFASDGHEGFGGLDIYKAKWNERTQLFSDLENVGAPINSSYDDISMALYPDGRSSYFSSNRPAEKGGDNIYYYHREKKYLNLIVTDDATKQPLTDVTAEFESATDPRPAVPINGTYFTRLYPRAAYKVKLKKEGYQPKEISIVTADAGEADTITREVTMAVVPPPPPPPAVVATEATAANPRFDAPEVRELQLSKTYEIEHFSYDLNKFDLNSEKRSVLDTLADVLKKHPTMTIQVQAHTDCRGTPEYNLKLSNARAGEVVKYLIEKGIDPKRLQSMGFGYTKPAVKCPDCSKCSEEDHLKNRILEFKVLGL